MQGKSGKTRVRYQLQVHGRTGTGPECPSEALQLLWSEVPKADILDRSIPLHPVVYTSGIFLLYVVSCACTIATIDVALFTKTRGGGGPLL